MKKIENHPADSTYTVGVNQFSDLTWDEFTKGYLMNSINNTIEDGE